MQDGDDILVRAFCRHAYITSDARCCHCGEDVSAEVNVASVMLDMAIRAALDGPDEPPA